MRIREDKLSLSATDLSNHLHCRHLTQLNLAVARGERDRPKWSDPRAEVLRERGYEHEARYLEELRAAGTPVVEVVAVEEAGKPEGSGGSGASSQRAADPATVIGRTLELMKAGAEAIAQGALAHDSWFGKPDVLLRVESESRLGPWSYEVVDTKLARETRGATVLQLCLYSELVAAVQGEMPEWAHVVSPGEPLVHETYRLADYLAYHRWIKKLLREAEGPTYPEPVEHCQVCAYWQECDQRRRSDDHLSLVAGASRGQRREFEEHSIATLARLAAEPIPLGWKPTRGAVPTYEKTREQARVQLEGRTREAPYYELLELEPERGLARLPEPDPADVFFDFEGDAFVGTAGLEYVFGWATLTGETGQPVYRSLWSIDAESERRAFERFVDAMIERLEAHPGFHIYHFTPYEPSALKRLMGRYATREAEIDQLLRGRVMVDLHSVVRQSLRAALEKYSLKELERYCGFVRELELDQARRALFRVERMLELGQGEKISETERERVLDYNREDCLSTLALRDWLETLRAGELAAGRPIERPGPPEDEASEDVKEHAARVAALVERLTEGVPVEEQDRTAVQQASWILAHIADYHRREMKVKWWEKFRLQDLGDDELREDPAGIAGLELVGPVEDGDGKGRRLVATHRYRFPSQEVKLKVKADVWFGDRRLGALTGFDAAARTIDVKKMRVTETEHPVAVFLHSNIRPKPKPEALLSFAEAVAEEGWNPVGPGRAGRDLLLRLPPRLADVSDEGSIDGADRADGAEVAEGVRTIGRGPRESSLEAAKRLVTLLDHGVVPIQGPPGSGKTYAGARMALELIGQGKRVGVAATAHKVMRNFLNGLRAAAEEAGAAVRCAHKDKPENYDEDSEILVSENYEKLRQDLTTGAIDILAGTAWLWAREDFRESVDVLFIDEAGQMALADVLVCARGAKSLVLLGDPQQLDQPQQGSHPDGTHVSALEHLLGGYKTLQPGQGLFLEETYRLHPELCRFTSELFYENRLHPVPGLENQVLAGPVLEGAGLWYLAVEHEGNQSASLEEVEAVGKLVERLTDGTTTWTDQRKKSAPLALEQILIVAPYNAQVNLLKERLPDARIGTVDKFQGREAPVVIYSTGTSSPDLAPRGMEFLYDASRLNVATSRALSACVLVGNPQIFEPECRTPRQIKLANAFCRYLEVARRLEVPDLVARARERSDLSEAEALELAGRETGTVRGTS